MPRRPALSTRKAPPTRSTLLYLETQAEDIALAGELVEAHKNLVLLHAPDLESLIKLARRERPEVLLINIDVAGLAPRDLVQRLRAEPALQEAPILALGTDAKPSVITQSLEAGVFLYLAKPLQAQPFMEALAFALEFAAAERAEQL
jgi:CheY-like chemotaxis protein